LIVFAANRGTNDLLKQS